MDRPRLSLNIWVILAIMNGHFSGIMNSVSVNISLQVFLWIFVFISFGYIARSGIAGSYANSMFNMLRNCQTFSKQLLRFRVPPALYEVSNFSTSLLTLVIFSWCWCYFIVVLICLTLRINDKHLFMFIFYWYILGKYQVLCLLLNWVIYIFISEL